MNSKSITNPAANERKDEKQLGCWSKFKSLFEDRGFDLEYEYNSTNTGWSDTQSDVEGYKRIEDRKVSILKNRNRSINSKQVHTMEANGGELSGVNNFYDQFGSIEENTKDDDVWRRPSTFRPRISVRPSIYLTNIVEETSDVGDDEIEEVSTYTVSVAFHFSDKHLNV